MNFPQVPRSRGTSGVKTSHPSPREPHPMGERSAGAHVLAGSEHALLEKLRTMIDLQRQGNQLNERILSSIRQLSR